MWSIDLCLRATWPDIVLTFAPGKLLVRFYGEHSSSWISPKHLVKWDDGNEQEKVEAMKSWGKKVHRMKLITATLAELEGRGDSLSEELLRLQRLGNAYQEVPDMRCGSCQRWLHALCSTPSALSPAEYPPDMAWTCPGCGSKSKEKLLPEEELLQQSASAGCTAERMGLTPDWIISAAAFRVFQLPKPTPEQPYIAGLLDPACNSKLEPNIPAEVLYDKQDDGLSPRNPWKGYNIILNPDFRAQVQWKAIDEVENGNVPSIILICRNSTDTNYFQRLRPYPRILLRRSSAKFKDYEKSPIGFGVVVFCIAKSDCRQLYERFYESFSPWGEPNIPIDTEFMAHPAFYELLDRLRQHAEQTARDHWVQCTACSKWRIISWQQLAALKGQAGVEWTCSMLRPPHTSCATRQSKTELAGVQTCNLPAVAAAGQEQHEHHEPAAACGPAAVTADRPLMEPATTGVSESKLFQQERWLRSDKMKLLWAALVAAHVLALPDDLKMAFNVQAENEPRSLLRTAGSLRVPAVGMQIQQAAAAPEAPSAGLLTPAAADISRPGDEAIREHLETKQIRNSSCARSGGQDAAVAEHLPDVAGGAAELNQGDCVPRHTNYATAGETAAGPQRQHAVMLSLLQAAPVCLSHRAVLAVTTDPLLRAALIEQPDLMKATRALLQQVCLYKQQQQQHGPALTAAEELLQQQYPPHSYKDRLAGADELLDVEGHGLICWDTVDRLTSSFRSSRSSSARHVHQLDLPEDWQEGANDEGASQAGSDEAEEELVSALELARQARVAANKAYLRGLGLTPSAIQQGLIRPLALDHMAVVAAARKLAQQEAVAQAEVQLLKRQRLLDAARRLRRGHELRLKVALESLAAGEARAVQQLEAARQTLEDVKIHQLFG
eukprot:gene7949-8147_t